MAMVYTVSNNGSVYPGMRVAGRSAGIYVIDLGDTVVQDGRGTQTNSTGWGTYANIQLDPSDNCTFWAINEYIATTGEYGWGTTIASFSLPGCRPVSRTDLLHHIRSSSRCSCPRILAWFGLKGEGWIRTVCH